MSKTDWDSSYAAVVDWARPFVPDHSGPFARDLPRSGKFRNGRRWGLRLPRDANTSSPPLLIKPSRLSDVQDIVRRWIRIRAVLGQAQIVSAQCKDAHRALVRTMHAEDTRVTTYVLHGNVWHVLTVNPWDEVSWQRTSDLELDELDTIAQLATERTAIQVLARAERVSTLWRRLRVVERVMIPILIRCLPRCPTSQPQPPEFFSGCFSDAERQAWFRLTVEGFVFRFCRKVHAQGSVGEWIYYASHTEAEETLFEGRLAL